MRIGRTLPPAAAPISGTSFLRGIRGMARGRQEIESLKQDFRDYFRVKHCFLLSSGKAALTVILKALKRMHPERDEVLVPAFTCYSVPSAVVRAGLKIRLGDMNPGLLDYDFEFLEKSLDKKGRVLAAVSTHLFGLPADISRLRKTLDDPGITVIEDAAQAMGGARHGRYLGTIGDAGFFSLGRGKAFSAVQGGVILTDSDELEEAVSSELQRTDLPAGPGFLYLFAYALALSVLTHPFLFWLPKSVPALKLGETIYDPGFPVNKFTPFQAGLTGNWKKELKELQQVRALNAGYWSEALAAFPWAHPAGRLNGSAPGGPLIRFPVLIKDASLRKNLLLLSERNGLGIMPSYPGTINRIHGLRDRFKGQEFPGAEECADCLATLPVHNFVSAKDRQRIVDALKTVNGSRN